MSLIQEIDPRSVVLSTELLGTFGNRDFEKVVTKFIKHLQNENKTFSSSFNKEELKMCGFLNNINDCQGSYPINLKIILDYFIKVGCIEIIEQEYFVTDNFVERIISFVKK